MARTRRIRRSTCVVSALVVAAVVTACGGTAANDAASGDAAASLPGTAPSVTAASTARPSAGCAGAGSTATTAPGSSRTVDVDGVERSYHLAAPATTEPAPLIVLLHGMGSNGADIGRVSDLPARATAAGSIVVTPDAVGSPTLWRAGVPGPDAAFLDALLDDVGADLCVDTSRIGLAGFSVGALFAAAYACARQDRVAAIVTVEVDTPGACDRPLPILAFHGTADPVVPYGPATGTPGGGAGTEANLARWAEISGCAADPVSTEVGSEVVRIEWPGCADGSEVVLYKILGGGHDWPGKDPATAVRPSTTQVSATGEAIAFLGRHAQTG